MASKKSLLFVLLLCVCMSAVVSGNSSFYRVLRKDPRRCAFPLCGGFFVGKVNTIPQKEMYVARIRLGSLGANVQKAYQELLVTFPNNFTLALFEGSLVKHAVSWPRVLDLNVTHLYIGYPGEKAGSDPYYKIISRGIISAIPVNLEVPGHIINEVKPTPTSIRPLVDQGVQLDQIINNGAVVVGSIQSSNIIVKQVFFRLPISRGVCPVDIGCAPGKKRVFKRNPELCFEPSCVIGGPCFLIGSPSCPTGYRLSGWPCCPRGYCEAFACDPFFFPIATKLPF